MIKAILVFNNHGKPRLSKFYQYFNEDMQQQIIKETFQLVSKRDDNVCNFLEGGSLIGGSDYKLIYRHYATLYFVFCVDSSESELGILDLIQVFVETLDKCFENVCELDLIFHADAVHHILSELVMGGMVLQTNMADIMARIEEQNKLVKQEAGISAAPARAVSAVKSMNIPQQIKDIKLPDLPQAIKDLNSFAAYAFNNSGSGHNHNSLTLNNKNVYASSVSQFLNQCIYEPIEDDNYSPHISTTFPNAETIASAFNYDYYQSQTCMDPETCNSFESNSVLYQQEKSVAKNLADVAEAHEQSMKLFRESFDLDAARQPLDTDAKKKHKRSKRYSNH
ncbi:hypothetical protein FF38_03034 [Lucilia cuprina]|uniref:AP complex mu/sigma subunit domain-containing protein n=1 Tax=Lucilia cuprina TaxID=7375 RepID=A0A0L0CDX6_LUCCU|nr:AP-3 complex subunit sigma-2 [Lucilia cuprina]KNC29699.1 hypothetical protein FF38_03034 [Lucilia cuprina]